MERQRAVARVDRSRMRRRKFLSLLSGAAAAWPLAARAQQPGGMRRIGVLMNLSEEDPEAQQLIATFRQGLAQLGGIDGRNLPIDYRWRGGDIEQPAACHHPLIKALADPARAFAFVRHRNGSSASWFSVLAQAPRWHIFG